MKKVFDFESTVYDKGESSDRGHKEGKTEIHYVFSTFVSAGSVSSTVERKTPSKSLISSLNWAP